MDESKTRSVMGHSFGEVLFGVAVFTVALLVLIMSVSVAYADTGEAENDVLTYEWYESVPIDLFKADIYPGARGEENFSVRNTSNYALQYKLVFYGEEGVIPLLYRIKTEDGYILGDENNWESVTLSESAKPNSGTLPLGGKLDLTLEWWWPYESGNDDRDTQLGILETEEQFYVALKGVGRDADGAPVIIRTDLAEVPEPSIVAVIALIAVVGIEVVERIVQKKEENRDETEQD